MIYFAQPLEGGNVKIGVTQHLPTRLGQLERELGAKLEVLGVLPGDHDVERDLHRRFAHLRVQGEWFLATTDLLNFISLFTEPWDARRQARLYRLVRIRLPLADRLDALIERYVSNATELANRAVRELLAREGLWPPPRDADD